jgi:glycogen debranching enzyme
LDPADPSYRGDYCLDEVNSMDYYTASGFNYHQGPVLLHPYICGLSPSP